MRELPDVWAYVAAAYVVTIGASVSLVAWSLWTMRRAEKRRDATKRRR